MLSILSAALFAVAVTVNPTCVLTVRVTALALAGLRIMRSSAATVHLAVCFCALKAYTVQDALKQCVPQCISFSRFLRM
jgi:hypothetical protein